MNTEHWRDVVSYSHDLYNAETNSHLRKNRGELGSYAS